MSYCSGAAVVIFPVIKVRFMDEGDLFKYKRFDLDEDNYYLFIYL